MGMALGWRPDRRDEVCGSSTLTYARRSFRRVDDPVEELFALPPSEFTAARNALVKQLRADKRREEADALKALKRPSVPAWAVNQVARAEPDGIERLIAAGAAVGAAQRRALSGVRDSGLRDASAARRDQIDRLWQAAAEILRSAGTEPAPHRAAIAATLEAASVDPEAAEAVRRGRLSADLPAPSGFGAVGGFTLVPDEAAPPTDARPTEGSSAGPDADEAARDALELQLADARRDAGKARRRADQLADRAAEARRASVRRADEAERLERRAAQARERADAEAVEADEATAAAEAAGRHAAAAEARSEELAASLPPSSASAK